MTGKRPSISNSFRATVTRLGSDGIVAHLQVSPASGLDVSRLGHTQVKVGDNAPVDVQVLVCERQGNSADVVIYNPDKKLKQGDYVELTTCLP